MKILIFNSDILSYHHFCTELEIALTHKSKNDDIYYLSCNSSLHSCEANIYKNYDTCFDCLKMKSSGLNILNLPEQNKFEFDISKYLEQIKIPNFMSLKELIDFEFEGVDVGNAVVSSLISLNKDVNLDVMKERRKIKKLLISSIGIYLEVYEYLIKIQPDYLYIYNGRFATSRPAIRAAQKLGVKFFTHERAGNFNRYFIIENTYVQDIDYFKKQIEIHWEKETNFDFKKKYAEKWFIERKENSNQGWFSYTKEQTKKKLPDNFNYSKRNIVIFNSSEYEMAVLNLYKNINFKTQNEAIINILNMENDPNICFYLRIHPNLKGYDKEIINELDSFNFKNLFILPADSDFDTYALMDSCEKVVTFASTTGIEAAFWNKPSILFGRAFYEDLKSCYLPKDYHEFNQMINSEISPLSKEGALKYGYWENTNGIEFEYYKPEDYFNGKILNKYLSKKIETKKDLFQIKSNLDKHFI